jgi:hypothetical protein
MADTNTTIVSDAQYEHELVNKMSGFVINKMLCLNNKNVLAFQKSGVIF